MTDIDVTPILDEDCGLLSASQFELGPEAGKITWRNCLALAERLPLVTDENRDGVHDHFREYGAWKDEEIDAWTDTELSAMVWQEAAAGMREFEDACDSDLARYETACSEGSISGRLSLTETTATIYLGV